MHTKGSVLEESPMRGRFVVVSGPSGAGKTSLIKMFLERHREFGTAISCTTRRQRGNETDRLDYFFLDYAQFETHLTQGKFLEHAEVHGQWYGTLRDEVVPKLEGGMTIVKDLDCKGARQVKECLPESISVFILPPSKEELEHRLLVERADMPLGELQRRLAEAVNEIRQYRNFDFVIISQDIETEIRALNRIAHFGNDVYSDPRRDIRLAGKIEKCLHTFDIVLDGAPIPEPERV